jgi:hypothetical protein
MLGYFAAVRLHKKDKGELQKGAGRALLAEMLTNADRALSLGGTHQPERLSDTVWFSQSAVISGLLPWNRLAKVVEAYDAGARLSSSVHNEGFIQFLKKDDRRAHSICLDVAGAFLNAVELIRDQKGILDEGELSDLDKRLKQLRDQEISSRKKWRIGQWTYQ